MFQSGVEILYEIWESEINKTEAQLEVLPVCVSISAMITSTVRHTHSKAAAIKDIQFITKGRAFMSTQANDNNIHDEH